MITISLVGREDWEDVKKIRLEALKEDPQAFGSSFEKESSFSDEAWQERMLNNDVIVFIAKEENVAIGMIGIHIKREEKSAHLWGMFVSKSHRGKGLGRQLMEKAVEKAKALPGTQRILLDVNPDQTAAITLYESIGFRKTGKRNYLMGDGKERQLIIMTLNVSS